MSTLNTPFEKRILFQNEACMVINKLPGESSGLPAQGTGGEDGLLPVHRLDQPVSGCFLLARNKTAAAFLSAAFAGKKGGVLEKRYWAITEKPRDGGAFPAQGEIVHWLYEDRKANKSSALPWQEEPPLPEKRRGPRRPKKAVLKYRVAGRGENYLFLEITLVTGRHHQIRAQLAALGLHIKGDLKYGARRSEKNGGIRLHAYSLAFPDPLNPAETIRVEALPAFDLSGSMDPLWKACADAVSGSRG